MVKVDNQSCMDLFCAGVLPISATQAAYQRALQSSSAAEFSSELLQCMSHGSDVFFNLGPNAAAMRNSFDFQPRMPERQQRHLAVNAANAILHHTVVFPDWDMFQTAHPAAGLHAAARAISGGPVYVSDKPGEHDIALVRKLFLPDHGWEIVTAAPVMHGLSLFGLIDKFNGSQVISHTSWDTAKQTFTAKLTAGGRIGFHAVRPPPVSSSTAKPLRRSTQARASGLSKPPLNP